ncbi:MAG: enoyl-CoA hydratase/isomerase family protein [Deltaproteobacteria bacterium]|nr:enoyl-CoA hydratase/isomerase family protein [Deltaproteobacteria bacterium]MBW2394540.1 enoyl-CoA hydratase/isomerase family protein [Deltaproteobacteria bacterium]
MSDLGVELEGRVARVEIQRGPANFFDMGLIRGLADTFHELAEGDRCRAIVLCSEGKHFCAGADFSGRGQGDAPGDLYAEAVRLFEAPLPFVAAIQGAAIGGGLGLALAADFRVACAEARFAANFARLGFHQGFGLSVTLPELVGPTAAAELLYTGRRVKGEEALALGLCSRLVPREELREAAHALAQEIALSAPLAVRSIRRTLRGNLAGRIREATDHEQSEQDRLRKTADFAEGVKAMAERREPRFEGK